VNNHIARPRVKSDNNDRNSKKLKTKDQEQ